MEANSATAVIMTGVLHILDIFRDHMQVRLSVTRDICEEGQGREVRSMYIYTYAYCTLIHSSYGVLRTLAIFVQPCEASLTVCAGGCSCTSPLLCGVVTPHFRHPYVRTSHMLTSTEYSICMYVCMYIQTSTVCISRRSRGLGAPHAYQGRNTE